MDANKDNVIAIHCKGGKGRTGTMICIWLLESKECPTAEVILNGIENLKTKIFIINKESFR